MRFDGNLELVYAKKIKTKHCVCLYESGIKLTHFLIFHKSKSQSGVIWPTSLYDIRFDYVLYFTRNVFPVAKILSILVNREML